MMKKIFKKNSQRKFRTRSPPDFHECPRRYRSRFYDGYFFPFIPRPCCGSCSFLKAPNKPQYSKLFGFAHFLNFLTSRHPWPLSTWTKSRALYPITIQHGDHPMFVQNRPPNLQNKSRCWWSTTTTTRKKKLFPCHQQHPPNNVCHSNHARPHSNLNTLLEHQQQI